MQASFKSWRLPLIELHLSNCVLDYYTFSLKIPGKCRLVWNAKLTYIQIFVPIFKYLYLGTNNWT